jgi:hypothetical protein
MRLVSGLGLAVLFVLGALVGLALGVLFIFWVSLYRGKRAVHADGVLCRAEVIAHDKLIGPALAPTALVRLSGAFAGTATTGHDVLGLDIRFQHTAADDASVGDQDLLLGSFESFHSAPHDEKTTDAVDYLDNTYSTVTPWSAPGHGPVVWHVERPPRRPVERAADRTGRLDADIVDDVARFVLRIDDVPVVELRLTSRLGIDQRTLKASMFRTGRGVRPTGFRNGIRATVYPISQFARGLRGG